MCQSKEVMLSFVSVRLFVVGHINEWILSMIFEALCMAQETTTKFSNS